MTCFEMKNGVLQRYMGRDAEVVIPPDVTQIGPRAFYENDHVERIVIPDGVKEIGDNAFSGCKRLRRVALPTSVQKLGEEVFWGCLSLTAIDAAPGNRAFSSGDGVLYSRDGRKLLRYPPARPAETFAIPGDVKKIDSCAFQACRFLKRVTVPGGVRKLGDAFGWCKSLEEITLPDGLTEIGSSAFYSCESLRNLRIPGTVRTIGEQAFNGCRALESIVIPAGVTRIGEGAFYDSGVSRAVIPASVRAIGKKAFGYWRMSWEYKGDLIVHGQPGTAAERYARDNGFPFVPLYVQPGPGSAETTGQEI